MGLTYLDLQIMGSLYVFDTLSSLPIAPIETPASSSCEMTVMQAVLEYH